MKIRTIILLKHLLNKQTTTSFQKYCISDYPKNYENHVKVSTDIHIFLLISLATIIAMFWSCQSIQNSYIKIMNAWSRNLIISKLYCSTKFDKGTKHPRVSRGESHQLVQFSQNVEIMSLYHKERGAPFFKWYWCLGVTQ